MIERDKFYFRVFCIAFWILAVGNFVLEELLPFIHGGQNFLMMLVDITLLILGIATLKNKVDKILIAIFVVLGVLSSIINKIPTLYWINGFRDYFPMLLALPIMRYFFTCRDSDLYRKSIDKQLKVFLILQAFCVTEQFLRYGAGDHGGGSLGNMNSGNISISIIFLSFYFVCKDWDGENYMKSLWRNRLYIFLLFPVFLNETKVSFVFLFVYFILLITFNIKSFGKIFMAAPAIILVACGSILMYQFATGTDSSDYDDDFFKNYLTGGDNVDEILELADTALDFVEEAGDTWEDNGWAYVDIPRIMKFPIMWQALKDSKGDILLGAGIGHLKGGSTLQRTEFYDDHIPLFYGTRMHSMFIFIPLGFLGVIWMIFWYKHCLNFRNRYGAMAFKIKLFLLFLVILSLFYTEMFRHYIICFIFYYLCLSTSYPYKPKIKDGNSSHLVHNSSGF